MTQLASAARTEPWARRIATTLRAKMPTEIAPHAAAPPNPVAAASPLLALLAAGSAPSYELLAAVHRLNELFAEAESHALAVELAGALVRAPPSAAATLLRLLVDGDALVELVVQLLGNASVSYTHLTLPTKRIV